MTSSEANESGAPAPHAIETLGRRAHDTGVALGLKAQGYDIDAVPRTEAGETTSAAAAPGIPLTEVAQRLDCPYDLRLHIRASDNLNIIEVPDPATNVLARDLQFNTNVVYRRTGEPESVFLFRADSPARTEVFTDPLDPETILCAVYGRGETMPLPSGATLEYTAHYTPTYLDGEGLTKDLALIFAAGVLVGQYRRHGQGTAFAQALTDVLKGHLWTATSTRAFVARIAQVAGDGHVAQMALDGRFQNKAWIAGGQAVRTLRGSVDEQAWARVAAGLRHDPRFIQRQWGQHPQATIAFVGWVENMEHDALHHQRG